jgi:predicted  nucleic acid-binding Zn-ribbon protein
MSEEPTKDMSGQTFEERVLAEFVGINTQLGAIRGDIAALDLRLNAVEQRLTTVEDKVDARLRETQPIWEAVLAKIDRLDEKFDTVIQDIYEVRTDIRQHAKRLTELERRPHH